MVYKVAAKVANLELSATDEVDNIVKRMRRAGLTISSRWAGASPALIRPLNIQDAAERAMHAGMTKYEPTTGAYEFREALAAKFVEENGIDVGPEDIIVTPGGKFAIYLAFQAVLEPGDRVMVLEPAWVSYKSMAQLAGAERGERRLPGQQRVPARPGGHGGCHGRVGQVHRCQLAQQSHGRSV